MNTAERIYVASTNEGGSPSRLAEALARHIEDDIAALRLTPGGSLGSLRELAERYGAGRSVVREAVGLLERRGLGYMRPGPCGGFILARPSPETIGRELASYFRASGVTPTHVQDARDVAPLLESGAEPVRQLLEQCLDNFAPDLALPARTSPPTAGNRAAAIAHLLAAEIARTGRAGARIGSEWDLCERFGVGRLTLRQAIRLLQDTGLVECRRGRGHGLVVRDRGAVGSIRLLLAYLIAEQVDPNAVGTTLFQLNSFVPALAVSRATAEQRRQLDAALARVETAESIERYELLGLVQYISRLADSPIIDLFSRCLVAYEARFRTTLAVRLPAAAQADYFALVRNLLSRAQIGPILDLAWAKAQSAALMLEMSRNRPL